VAIAITDLRLILGDESVMAPSYLWEELPMKNLSPWCVDMELSKVSSETAPWEMELERGGRRVRHKLSVNLETEGECNAIGCKFQQTKGLKSVNVFFSHKCSSQEQPREKNSGRVIR
jgi:hypothetical protein